MAADDFATKKGLSFVTDLFHKSTPDELDAKKTLRIDRNLSFFIAEKFILVLDFLQIYALLWISAQVM